MGITSKLYPFIVSEKGCCGEEEFSEAQTDMHGFALVIDRPMIEKLCNCEAEGGLKPGTKVYEIRVKNNSGQWQDWQVIVGEIKILPLLKYDLGGSFDEVVDDCKKRFQDNFQIRYSGILWNMGHGEPTIVDEEIGIIKRIDLFTLKIEYKPDFDKAGLPFEEQIKDQLRFREKYYPNNEEMG